VAASSTGAQRDNEGRLLDEPARAAGTGLMLVEIGKLSERRGVSAMVCPGRCCRRRREEEVVVFSCGRGGCSRRSSKRCDKATDAGVTRGFR
jgi:hypothetical protein